MNTEAKVGIFVVAAAVLLATTLYFVRTTQTVRGQVPFKTYFHDAGGLAPDASVLFGGIKVGQITEALSPSEARVLRLIADGLSNKQIAERLSMTEEGVKGQVKSILSKLDARDRTHAAVIGIRSGLIDT